jgi:hypothetical protein
MRFEKSGIGFDWCCSYSELNRWLQMRPERLQRRWQRWRWACTWRLAMCQMPNVRCQMPDARYQMSDVGCQAKQRKPVPLTFQHTLQRCRTYAVQPHSPDPEVWAVDGFLKKGIPVPDMDHRGDPGLRAGVRSGISSAYVVRRSSYMDGPLPWLRANETTQSVLRALCAES